MYKRFFLLNAVLVVLLSGSPVSAESQEETGPRADGKLFSINNFTFRVGFYNISSSTKIRVDGAGGLIGTTINLENDLNLDEEKATSYLSVGWRVSGRHHLELEQFNLRRDGLQTLTAEIEFGDRVFEVNANVDSFFNTNITRLSYSYTVRDTARSKVALGVGLHRTKISAGIAGTAGGIGEDRAGFAEVTAPLPVIGVDAAWKFNERWSIGGRLQLFRLQIADYSGRLDHATVRLEYDPFKYVGFGVGYDFFSMRLDVERDLWTGNVTYQFNGPIAFVKGHF